MSHLRALIAETLAAHDDWLDDDQIETRCHCGLIAGHMYGDQARAVARLASDLLTTQPSTEEKP